MMRETFAPNLRNVHEITPAIRTQLQELFRSCSLSSLRQLTQFILFAFLWIHCLVVQAASIPSSLHASHFTPPLIETSQKEKPEIIILVHGLLRSSISMWPLKYYLKRQGYIVYSYSYPSAKFSIQEHGRDLNFYIKNIIATHPEVKVNFVTHSLGGIITREALANFSPLQLKNIGSLIMLAPPNQGSELAKLSLRLLPVITSAIKPLAELSADKASYIHQVPVPNINIGIIAGRYDAKVPPKFARLGKNMPVIVNSTHTFIMNNGKTWRLIRYFLKKRSFDGFQ